MRFAEYSPTNDTFSGNVITDDVGGATGMLFDYIASKSDLTLTGNTVSLLSSDSTVHRGLVFSQVGSNVTFSTVTGASSNSVVNATSGQSLVIPAGQGTGGILINGNLTLLPQ